MDIHPGDTVRIGNGYQRWTVLRVEGATLTVESSASYQTVASGSSTQVRQVDTSRVTVLTRAEPVKPEAAPVPDFDPSFLAKARELELDPYHCSGCEDRVLMEVLRDLGELTV